MDKIGKLNIDQVYESISVNEDSKAGTWIGDELIVRTYPLEDVVDRVVLVGYDLTKKKVIETKLRKVLGDLIKKDHKYTMSTIDILADSEIPNNEKADMIDSNVDEFLGDHAEALKPFVTYRRKDQ